MMSRPRGGWRQTLGLVLVGGVLGMSVSSVRAQAVTLAFQPKESTFEVRGTSTLHDWTCKVTDWQGTVALRQADELASLQAAEVVVSVGAIACGNGTMDRKMRKALKAKAHPEIRFELERIDAVAAGAEGYWLQVQGRLTVAGATQPVQMRVLAQPENGGWRFQGVQPLSMKAFGIKPPTAMLGALRTGDRVVVHFDVIARPRSDSP
ncbi:MAG: YceI family protein [Rhodothermus sp.]|nr:YceI family protein [Rhodothermus sp.]